KNNLTDDIINLSDEQVNSPPSNKGKAGESNRTQKTSGEPRNTYQRIVKPTPSIKKALNKIEQLGKSDVIEEKIEQENTEEAVVEEQDEVTEVNTFNQEALNNAWKAFAREIEGKSVRLASTVASLEPELNENFVIKIGFKNVAQLDHFKLHGKAELGRYLRENLKNGKIVLDEYVSEDNDTGTNTKFLTEQEKFNLLTEKSPGFKKLRQDFELDLD
ncbi:MAG: hypothetical protein MI922_23250, partial [Bacteroidales bacterium]|nr:hypothetical protein [Bacteroidales bacterium]